jgi:diguanylate cyclase (GGDEF)-like protein
MRLRLGLGADCAPAIADPNNTIFVRQAIALGPLMVSSFDFEPFSGIAVLHLNRGRCATVALAFDFGDGASVAMSGASWPNKLPYMNLTEFMAGRSKSLLVLTGGLLLAAVIFLDKTTSAGFETSVFYLVPISFFAAFLSRWSGLFVALICTGVALSLRRTHLAPSLSNLVYWNALAWLAVYVFFVYMISEILALYARERSWSHTDALTGLPNRRSFVESLETEKNRASRYNRPISLAYIDLDHFKEVNDAFGHATGDKLLAVVARVIKRDIRQIDVVARLGGDEFAVLLPETDRFAAAVALKKVEQSLEAAMKVERWPVTFSVGLVTAQPPPESIQELINAADEAMYEAKKGGRGRLIVHGPAA